MVIDGVFNSDSKYVLSLYVPLLVFVQESPQEESIGQFVRISFDSKSLFRAAWIISFCCLGNVVVCQKLLKSYSLNSYSCKKIQEHQMCIFWLVWVSIFSFWRSSEEILKIHIGIDILNTLKRIFAKFHPSQTIGSTWNVLHK